MLICIRFPVKILMFSLELFAYGPRPYVPAVLGLRLTKVILLLGVGLEVDTTTY